MYKGGGAGRKHWKGRKHRKRGLYKGGRGGQEAPERKEAQEEGSVQGDRKHWEGRNSHFHRPKLRCFLSIYSAKRNGTIGTIISPEDQRSTEHYLQQRVELFADRPPQSGKRR